MRLPTVTLPGLQTAMKLPAKVGACPRTPGPDPVGASSRTPGRASGSEGVRRLRRTPPKP